MDYEEITMAITKYFELKICICTLETSIISLTN